MRRNSPTGNEAVSAISAMPSRIAWISSSNSVVNFFHCLERLAALRGCCHINIVAMVWLGR